MYVVLLSHKSKPAMTDLIAALLKEFPNERFTVEGSEEKGYNARIEGVGDERAPRIFATKFLKTWKPKPDNIIELDVVMEQPLKFTQKYDFDEMLKSIIPK